MAGTKAQMKAKQQGALSLNAGLTTHAEHESFLHTDAASQLENFYADEIQETESSNSITVDNSDIDYDVKIVKCGRQVTINGIVNNVSARTLSTPTLFSIDASESAYIPNIDGIGAFSTANIGVASGMLLSTDTFAVTTSTNDIVLLGSLGIGELLFIDITYNTKN